MALCRGPDGFVYGATMLQFYRIRPGTAQRDILWRTTLGDEANYIRVPGPIISRTFYFGHAHRLRALDVPGHKPGSQDQA
jgi:hypothetical protein